MPPVVSVESRADDDKDESDNAQQTDQHDDKPIRVQSEAMEETDVTVHLTGPEIEQALAGVTLRRGTGEIRSIVNEILRTGEITDQPTRPTTIERIVVQMDVQTGDVLRRPSEQRRGFVDHLDLVVSKEEVFRPRRILKLSREFSEVIVVEVDREQMAQRWKEVGGGQ